MEYFNVVEAFYWICKVDMPDMYKTMVFETLTKNCKTYFPSANEIMTEVEVVVDSTKGD